MKEINIDKNTQLQISQSDKVDLIYCAGQAFARINGQEVQPLIHEETLDQFSQTIKFYVDRGWEIKIEDTYLGFGGEIIYARLPDSN